MAPVIRRLPPALLECQKLITQIDEGHRTVSAAKLEVEQLTVEDKRLVDITDLERGVIEADDARFSCLVQLTLLITRPLRPSPTEGSRI
jgi:hypothetical protein